MGKCKAPTCVVGANTKCFRPNVYRMFLEGIRGKGLSREEISKRYAMVKANKLPVVGKIMYDDYQGLCKFAMSKKKQGGTRKRATRVEAIKAEEPDDSEDSKKAERQKKVRKLAEFLKMKFKEFKPVDRVVDMAKRPLMIARGIVSTAKLGREACLVTHVKKIGNKKTVFATLQKKGERSQKGQLNAYTMLFSGGKKLGEGSYGIAYVTRTSLFIPSATKITSMQVPTDEPYEGKFGLYAARSVVNNQCPNLLCTLGYMVCSKNLPANIVVPKGVRNQHKKTKKYVVIIMELATGGTLDDLFDRFGPRNRMPIHSWVSLVFQGLFAIRLLHSSGVAHCDNHFGNYLFNYVKPGGYWHYRLEKDATGERYEEPQDFYIPNTGFQVLLTDYGLVKPFLVRRACKDLGRIVGENEWNDPETRKRILPECVLIGRSMQRLLEDLGTKKEDEETSTFFADNVAFNLASVVHRLADVDVSSAPDPSEIINKDAPYTCHMQNMEEFYAKRVRLTKMMNDSER